MEIVEAKNMKAYNMAFFRHKWCSQSEFDFVIKVTPSKNRYFFYK